MLTTTKQLGGNLWRPGRAVLDGPETSMATRANSLSSIGSETAAEQDFLQQNGPVNSESWKKSFPQKIGSPSGGTPAELPGNPFSSLVPSALPNHPVLPDGTPNESFYVGQSQELKNILGSAGQNIQPPGTLSPSQLGQLKLINPLAHDRYMSLAPDQQEGVRSFGPMDDLTMLIPKSASNMKSSVSSQMIPNWIPNEFEEVFSAKQPANGNAKAIGTRRHGDNWYLFGTEVGESAQKPSVRQKGVFGKGDEAATWFAPEDYVSGRNGRRSKPDLAGAMGPKQVIDDVQGIMQGPWSDYLKGPATGPGDHGVQAVHAGPKENSFQTFVGQFDKAKGILGTAKSVANAVQAVAKFAGLLGSLGEFGSMLGTLSNFKIPASPGEMITSLLKGSGCLGPTAPPENVKANASAGTDGVVVTTGGAGAVTKGKAKAAQLGKTKGGKGGQGKGTGSDKSVSKESKGGDVELGNEDSKPVEGSGTDKTQAEFANNEADKKENSIDSLSDTNSNNNDVEAGGNNKDTRDRFDGIQEILDSNDNDWDKATELVDLANGRFETPQEALAWIEDARRQSQEWSSSMPLVWSHYNLKGQTFQDSDAISQVLASGLFLGYDGIKAVGLDEPIQRATVAADNFVRWLEGRPPENPWKFEPSEWSPDTSDWFFAGLQGTTPIRTPHIPAGYVPHPLFRNKFVSPDGELLDASQVFNRHQV